jgi:hypothetical protein
MELRAPKLPFAQRVNPAHRTSYEYRHQGWIDGECRPWADFIAFRRRGFETEAPVRARGIVTVTGGVQRVGEVEPCFMQRQPHLAIGRLLRL